jgi:hypothetical protein
MSNEEILDELLHEVHAEFIFKEVILEVNKLMIDDINSSRLEIFEKAVRNVRRNKVI